MQKIKFDFEATKERIYAPNSNVPIGAPVDRNGNIANDGNAYGIVLCKETENEKYWVKYNLVVMVAGYCDIIDAQAIWGDEYSAEAMAAMSDIVFCDNHKIGGGDEWELIIDDTITQDISTLYTRNTDINGNPFRLKDCMILIDGTGNTEKDTVRFKVGLDSDVNVAWASENEAFAVPQIEYKTSLINHVIIRVTMFGDVMIPQFMRVRTKDGYQWLTLYDAFLNPNNLPSGFSENILTDYHKIDQVKFASYGNILLAGSRVRVWGVRA